MEYEERERVEDNSRSRRRWILTAVFAICVIVAIVVLVLVTSSNVSKDKQRAIELAKEYLDGSGSTYNSGMFETWEATGDKNMMVVCATYYPQSEEGGGEKHSEDVLHEMKWQVNLRTGIVIYMELVDPDG